MCFLTRKQNPVLYEILSFMAEIIVLSSGCGGQTIKKKSHLQILPSFSPVPICHRKNGICIFMVLTVKMFEWLTGVEGLFQPSACFLLL